jgi:hypothetical protein
MGYLMISEYPSHEDITVKSNLRKMPPPNFRRFNRDCTTVPLGVEKIP